MRDAHTGIRGYRSRCASYCQCAVIVCVFLIYFVFFAVVPVAAQQAPNDSAQEQEEQSEEDELGEGIDAILLMDGSASMRLTDPKRLRDQGARLFTEFLRQGDRLAILEFSADVKAIRPLTPYVPELSYQVQQQIARVGDSGQYTDLLAGIKAAGDLLRGSRSKSRRSAVIMFSDGKMEPAPEYGTPEGSKQRLLEEVLPALRRDGVRVHTLAFSEHADKDLLANVSRMTNGGHAFAPTIQGLRKSYRNLFLSIKKPQVLPLTKKGFPVDSGVEEATFYINREGSNSDIVIEAPTGKRYTKDKKPRSVKWYRGSGFDVITVRKPRDGNWKVIGLASSDSFATVLTNLKLLTVFPENKVVVDKAVRIEARLFERKKPVVLPEMTNAVTFAFLVTPTDKISEPIMRSFLADDGTQGDRRERDGVFTKTIKISEVGDYRLSVIARGPTFVRQQEISFRVKPRLIDLSVVKIEAGLETKIAYGEKGKASSDKARSEYLRIELSPEVARLKSRQVTLLALDQDSKRYNIPLDKYAAGELRYDVPVTLLPRDGEYNLSSSIVGRTRKRRKVSSDSNELIYIYKAPKGGEKKVVEEVVVVKTESEKPAEPEKPSSPIPYIILVLILNAASGGGAVFLFKKLVDAAGGEEVTEGSKYEPSEELLAAIAALEDKAAGAPVAMPELEAGPPAEDSEGAGETEEGAESASDADAGGDPADGEEGAADSSEQESESGEATDEEGQGEE